MHREKKSEHTCKAKYEEVGVSEKKWSKDQQGEVADCYGKAQQIKLRAARKALERLGVAIFYITKY